MAGQKVCSYPRDIAILYPEDQLLIGMSIEAYLGVPLYDSNKEATGILVCLFKEEIKDTTAIESTLLIFVSRAGAELEHMKLFESLKRHKNNLEVMVEERTKELNIKNVALESSNVELTKALQDLKDTQTKLIQSEKMASLGTLTSGVAHEINNPLNYLMGAYFGLSTYFETFESKDKETTEVLLESIKVGIDRISNIVKGLNMFSRNNDSMTELCDIHSILDNCFEILHAKTKFRINIKKEYSETPIFTKGNTSKLHQVFLNIITNSIQAIKDKGEITVTTRLENRNIIVTIKDTGKGIDQSLLNKILDPFFTTKEPGEGTGLGLSISHSIIKKHQGKIKFKSVVNQGTNVTVTLPMTQD